MSEFIKIPAETLERLNEQVKQLAHEKAQLELVTELMSKLTPVTGLENTVNRILHLLMDTIGGINLVLYYKVSDEWFSMDIMGARNNINGFDDPLVKRAFENRTFVEASSKTCVTGPHKERFSNGTTWVFPLIAGDELVGIIKMEGMMIATTSASRNQLQVFINYASLVLKNEVMNYSKLNAAYENIQEREQHIRLLLDSTAEAIYGLDINGQCTFANNQCCILLGYESSVSLVDKHMHTLIHHTKNNGTPYPAEECPIYQVVHAGKQCHTDEEVFWRADGTNFPVEYWSYPIRQNNQVVGSVVTFMDITERKKLEFQLLHSQKMEAVGQLAGGIAHDFNNILTAIVGYAAIIKRKTTEDDPLRIYADYILTASDRASNLTQSLLAFSRKQIFNLKPEDLNKLVENIYRLLKRLIGEDIELKTVLTHNDVTIMADSGQIEQVLMNLATNARDAMPKGGRLIIETEQIELDTEFAKNHGLETPGPYAVLSVTDTGIGINAKDRKKIFEPFFTTKELGKGTGLGLAIIYGILKQHNGNIIVYSEPEKGSTFKIYLPVIQSETEELTANETIIPKGGTETILLAEDDVMIRDLISSVLIEFGYNLIVAEDGMEATEKFIQNKDIIQLLVSDVVMPKKTGKELYDDIIKMRPDIKAIFLSGYPAEIIKQKDVYGKDMKIISKPIRPDDLLRIIREVLDKPALS